MTLLHQAAQKAVEALNAVRGDKSFCCLKEERTQAVVLAAIAQLSAALQHQEVPREPVATFRYEVQPDGEMTYDVWLSDGMFDIKTPGDYPLYTSPSTTRQPEVGSEDELVELRATVRGLNYLVRTWRDRAVGAGWTRDAAAPSTPENADGVGAPGEGQQ